MKNNVDKVHTNEFQDNSVELKNKYEKGVHRLKKLKKTTAIISTIGLAIGFCSSISFLSNQRYTSLDQMYTDTDDNVANSAREDSLNGKQEELRDTVGTKIYNSVFRPVFMYEDQKYSTNGTGFAIEELDEIDENFNCITTLMQSHSEISRDKMYRIGIRLPNTDKDITAITHIVKQIPYDTNLDISGWEFVALCFENEPGKEIDGLTYVGINSFGEYKPLSGEKVISVGLPRILEEDNKPTVFTSEHLSLTSKMIVGGSISRGESGGIIYSESREKIVGTILAGPGIKNVTQIQSIANLDVLLAEYNNFKSEVMALWNKK